MFVLAFNEHINYQPYTIKEAVPILICSLLYLMGLISFNGAISYGKAGTTQAMIQIQAPFQLALEMSISHIYPPLEGFLGMFVCIVGALVIILSKN